ncbi:MAG: glycosyl hydrolase [Planctomycetota bacterium]
MTIFAIADTCTPWPCPIPSSPTSRLVAFADPWWQLVAYAASEARRLGLDLGVHNSPGCTHSGGPWIPPELSVLELCWSETSVEGGRP